MKKSFALKPKGLGDDEKTEFSGNRRRPAVSGKHRKKKGLSDKLKNDLLKRSKASATSPSSDARKRKSKDQTISRDEDEVQSEATNTIREMPTGIERSIQQEVVEAVSNEKKPNSKIKLKTVTTETSNEHPKQAAKLSVGTKKVASSESVTIKKVGEKNTPTKRVPTTSVEDACPNEPNADTGGTTDTANTIHDHSVRKDVDEEKDKDKSKEPTSPPLMTPPNECFVFVAPPRTGNEEVDMIEVMATRNAEKEKEKESAKPKKERLSKSTQT